jgi:hypothetical protein
MVIIKELTYNKIVDFLTSYRGLSIESEEEVAKRFSELPRDTIRSIISKHGQNSLKLLFYKYTHRTDVVLAE